MTFLDYVPYIEVQILSRLLLRIIEMGWSVSVYDEDGKQSVDHSTDFTEISAETFATQFTIWSIYDNDRQWVGTITLIMGNGEEVFSNFLVPHERANVLTNLLKGDLQ